MAKPNDDYEYHLYEELRAGRLSRRQFLQRASIAGVALPTVSAILAACGSSSGSGPATSGAGGAPRHGGTLRIGVTGVGTSIDPVTAYTPGQLTILQLPGEYLCQPRDNLTLAPVLATSWSADASAKTWTFKLRQGVKFQDGSPMTTADVVATFERLVNPKSQSAALSAFQGILSSGQIEGSGNSVIFHLDRPFADFPFLTTNYNYNTIILPASYKENTFTKGKIGTGPMILTQYVPGQSAAYVRNPHYWAPGKPYLDKIAVTLYGDAAPMVLALQNSTIDYVTAFDYQDAKPLLSDSSLTIHSGRATSYRALAMRVDKAPFSDKRVRQAMALTLSRPALVKGLLGGHGELGNDHGFPPVLKTTPTASELPQRVQDLTKAKHLLAAAGHSSGLNVTLTTENYLEIPSYVTIVKSEAAKVGININLDIMTATAYYGSGNNQPWLQVPFGCTEWATRPDAGQNIEPLFLSKGVWNEGHYKNPVLDRLMIAYDGELDLTKRKKLALQAATIMHDDVPVIISYWIDTLTPASSTVHGVNVNATNASGMWLA
ncbi:MAG: ABC transporter substrate-binding protein [Nocardiopsaceae bacterium]|jgi:peptide/nickel transport system substrate-binding protein|nr:ABC transporter substrate-binding protein [Nocardiopsaceae bacterium]